MDASALQSAWSAGRMLTVDQAVEMALED
jgi:hypothetical protein